MTSLCICSLHCYGAYANFTQSLFSRLLSSFFAWFSFVRSSLISCARSISFLCLRMHVLHTSYSLTLLLCSIRLLLVFVHVFLSFSEFLGAAKKKCVFGHTLNRCVFMRKNCIYCIFKLYYVYAMIFNVFCLFLFCS